MVVSVNDCDESNPSTCGTFKIDDKTMTQKSDDYRTYSVMQYCNLPQGNYTFTVTPKTGYYLHPQPKDNSGNNLSSYTETLRVGSKDVMLNITLTNREERIAMAETEPEVEPKPEPEPEPDPESDCKNMGGDYYNGTCIYYVGTAYTSIDCRASNSSNPLYLYCYPTPSTYSTDYWAGAKYKCDSMNMDLATVEQLRSVYNNKSHYRSIANNKSWYLVADEVSRTNRKYMRFDSGGTGNAGKAQQQDIMCIGR